MGLLLEEGLYSGWVNEKLVEGGATLVGVLRLLLGEETGVGVLRS